MRGRAAFAWAALLLSAAASAAVTGSFEGSGRACSGRLVVTATAAAWVTPQGRCKRGGYEVLEEGRNPPRAVFRLKLAGRACRTPVVVLRQHAAGDPDTGWEVIGYPSVAAFRADDDASALSCALVRLK